MWLILRGGTSLLIFCAFGHLIFILSLQLHSFLQVRLNGVIYDLDNVENNPVSS